MHRFIWKCLHHCQHLGMVGSLCSFFFSVLFESMLWYIYCHWIVFNVAAGASKNIGRWCVGKKRQATKRTFMMAIKGTINVHYIITRCLMRWETSGRQTQWLKILKIYNKNKPNTTPIIHSSAYHISTFIPQSTLRLFKLVTSFLLRFYFIRHSVILLLSSVVNTPSTHSLSLTRHLISCHCRRFECRSNFKFLSWWWSVDNLLA